MTENMKKWNRIMDYYRDGAYGEEHLTIAQILERAGEPNLIDNMEIEDLSELLSSLSSGPLKAWISHERDEKVAGKKAFRCLLLLPNHPLEVWKNGEYVSVAYLNGSLPPTYENGFIFHRGTGRGKTFEEACDDYLKNIEGKEVRFGNWLRPKEKVLIMPVHK